MYLCIICSPGSGEQNEPSHEVDRESLFPRFARGRMSRPSDVNPSDMNMGRDLNDILSSCLKLTFEPFGLSNVIGFDNIPQ